MKYNNFSCRYDSFFLIYSFIIKNSLTSNKNEINSNLEILNLISDEILTLNSYNLNNGIWDIIDKYKSNYDFLKISYKNENTINKLLHILNNNKNFCISFLSNEGCNKCLINKSEKKFLSAVINYDINYLHTFNIEQLIYFNLKNDIFICPFCGYSNDKIIDINNKSYFKIINNINFHNFLFIGFDLSTNNDNVDEKENPNSIGFINNIIWNRIKSNIDIIINLSVDNFDVYNTKFKLQGIICFPFV